MVIYAKIFMLNINKIYYMRGIVNDYFIKST